MAKKDRRALRLRRKKRVQKQLRNTSRPLLTVFRSSKHIYAQLADPLTGRTLGAVSTRTPSLREDLETFGNIKAAEKVGSAIARIALERGIREVSFNRNGFVYEGRVKALANAAREAGLGL